ncbi:ankyrin repeat-containing domain protein [Biscogniauxia mediterranea]|nr:ankyrin repeat-containing domain protein [Biscogniauxia mediterranea]
MEVIGVVASFIAIGQGLAAVPKIVSTIRSICKPGSELDALASDLAMLNKHDELDRLLSEKPELVHVAAPTGDTLLHVACRYAATGTASLLIRHGAHPDTRGACGDTPLHVSMSAGTLECTQLLLDKGADAKVLDSLGASLLHWAARSRSSERNDIIRSLLAAGVPIETTDIMKSTMLHRFAGSTTGVRDVGLSRERLKLILDAGGGGLLEARDRWGKTPLLTAISNRNHNALYALLEAGAQVNTADDYGFNPLHYAAEWGTVKVMEVLKEVRVTDLDIRTTNLTRYAATPLRWFRWQLRRDPDFVSPRWERPGDQETKAFEELLRDVRDRAISIEIAKLEGIISKIETGELVPAKEELVRLTEAKWKARIDWEAETFRAIGLDVRAGRIDLAIESLREFIEESRKRLEVSPFDEEDDPWATTANKEYSDDSEEEEEEGKEEKEDEGDEEEEDDDYDNTDSSDEDSD